jgi:glycosyltransferase involved in cell wall biosynthesis
MLITIFTPTYNRAYIIERAFESLCRQSDKNFEWVVVDDGSTDNTEELIREFQSKATFPVRYFKKENGGKHTAYNVGLEAAAGELFFDLDSDDWLPDDFMELTNSLALQLRANSNLCGIISAKSDKNGVLLGTDLSQFGRGIATYREFREKAHGEFVFIFKTEIATKYKFPVYPEEKFMPEVVVYDKFDDREFIIDNRTMTFLEYQPDGLTVNFSKLIVENPKGFLLCHHNRMLAAQSQHEKFSNMLQVGAFAQIVNKRYKTKIKWNVPGVWRVLLNPVCKYIAERYLTQAWYRNGYKL